MKQILTCLLLVVGFISVEAQDVISEGQLTMELTEVTADDPAVEQQMSMMKGMTMNVHFNDNGSLTQMDMMGGMIKSTSLSNTDGSGKLLMDMMGNKMYIPITKEEAEKAAEAGDEVWENTTISYDESDTKEIQGVKCHKMTIAPKEGTDGIMSMSGYVTKAIKANANIMQIDTKKFDGFPMELTIGAAGGKMTFTATKLEKSVDASVFDLDTGGYKEMTFQEFMDMMGQMGGGGFGF